MGKNVTASFMAFSICYGYMMQNIRGVSMTPYTEHGHPERKKPSLHGRKSTPTPKSPHLTQALEPAAKSAIAAAAAVSPPPPFRRRRRQGAAPRVSAGCRRCRLCFSGGGRNQAKAGSIMCRVICHVC